MACLHFISDDQDGVSRSIRDAPPAHYTFKIQLFSLLSKSSIERYDSADFEAGGYKWKLALYPNGNKNKNGKDHLSLYLAMAEPSALPLGWEVNVVFRFFLLDQIRDNYLTVQDTKETGKRFHRMKTEWGFDQFISLKAFNDASNGYLIDDTCVFGAEVFVCKVQSTGKGECLSMIKDAVTNKHSWRVDNFSKLEMECCDSKIFNAGDHQWKIQLYPKGKGTGKGTSLSLYLALADAATLPPGKKLYVEFNLRLVDQTYSKHWNGKVNYWFSGSSQECGWLKFMSLAYFYQTSTGYLVKDTCVVEAEVTVHGVTNTLS